MADWTTVCKIAANLPGMALDREDVPNPAWKAGGKVVIRRRPHLGVPDVEAAVARRGEVIAIRTDPIERAALLSQDPTTFFVTPHWESSTSVLVWLDSVDRAQLEELIVDGWRPRAHKRDLRAWEERGLR